MIQGLLSDRPNHPDPTATQVRVTRSITMRLALTLSAALMATGALAFVPPVPSARRSTKLVRKLYVCMQSVDRSIDSVGGF